MGRGGTWIRDNVLTGEPIPYATVLIPVLLAFFAVNVLCLFVAAVSGNLFLMASLVPVTAITLMAVRVLKERR